MMIILWDSQTINIKTKLNRHEWNIIDPGFRQLLASFKMRVTNARAFEMGVSGTTCQGVQIRVLIYLIQSSIMTMGKTNSI